MGRNARIPVKHNAGGSRDNIQFDADRALERAKGEFPGIRIRVSVVGERGEQALRGLVVTLPSEADQQRFATALQSNQDNNWASIRACMGKYTVRYETPEPR